MSDMDEINKFYKRSLVTGFLILGHVYALVSFSYESRLLTKERLPKFYGIAGFIFYPISMLCALPILWKQHNAVINRLDSKYTPIWLRISSRQSLFGDDDDDEEEEVKKPAAKQETST